MKGYLAREFPMSPEIFCMGVPNEGYNLEEHFSGSEFHPIRQNNEIFLLLEQRFRPPGLNKCTAPGQEEQNDTRNDKRYSILAGG
jgi:hypothetical protein